MTGQAVEPRRRAGDKSRDPRLDGKIKLDPPGIDEERDLRDKTIVVTAGTINEAAVRAISDKQHLGSSC